MAIGGCYCGKIRVELKGQALTSGLCHCLDCRKLTGGPYSYNFIVKSGDLNVSGNPKEVARTSDSANSVRNYFCGDCGTPLFGRKVKSNGDPDEITIVRAGIFDELTDRKPEAELFTDNRLKWVTPVEGAGQFNGMV